MSPKTGVKKTNVKKGGLVKNDKLLAMISSGNILSIEQAVDLGEALGMWSQYRPKREGETEIWYLEMDLATWERLMEIRKSHRRGKSPIFAVKPGKVKVYGTSYNRPSESIIERKDKMKITKRQLKRIIREEYSRLVNEYGSFHGGGAADQAYDRMRGSLNRPERKAHGWMEFIEMAEAGDYDGAAGWIQGLAQDYGIQLSRDEEDDFIMIGSGGDVNELKYSFDELLKIKGK